MFTIRRTLGLLFLVVLISLLYNSIFASNQVYWIKQLTTDEKEIFETISKERTTAKLTPLLLNGELSNAIKEELLKFIEAETDSPTVSEQIKTLFSNFQGKFYLFMDTTTEEIFGGLRQKKGAREEILDTNTRSVVIASVKTKLNKCYTCVYFSTYFIDYVMEAEKSIPIGGGTTKWIYEKIIGKSNAKYIKVLCYEGTSLPFFQRSKEVFEEEMTIGKDSLFEVSLPREKFAKQPWRVAVFVRNDPKESYELTKFFKRQE